MPKFSFEAALKSAQWERAKGELRALVHMQGSYISGEAPGGTSSETERWLELGLRVEAFIKSVEDDGLQE